MIDSHTTRLHNRSNSSPTGAIWNKTPQLITKWALYRVLINARPILTGSVATSFQIKVCKKKECGAQGTEMWSRAEHEHKKKWISTATQHECKVVGSLHGRTLVGAIWDNNHELHNLLSGNKCRENFVMIDSRKISQQALRRTDFRAPSNEWWAQVSTK